MQLSQEQANVYSDICSAWPARVAKITASYAFIEGDPTDMDFFALRRIGEPDRKCREPSHQIGTGAMAAGTWFAGAFPRLTDLRAAQAAIPDSASVTR